MLAMLDARKHLALRRAIAEEFVGDGDLRGVLQLLEQLMDGRFFIYACSIALRSA